MSCHNNPDEHVRGNDAPRRFNADRVTEVTDLISPVRVEDHGVLDGYTQALYILNTHQNKIVHVASLGMAKAAAALIETEKGFAGKSCIIHADVCLFDELYSNSGKETTRKILADLIDGFKAFAVVWSRSFPLASYVKRLIPYSVAYRAGIDQMIVNVKGRLMKRIDKAATRARNHAVAISACSPSEIGLFFGKVYSNTQVGRADIPKDISDFSYIDYTGSPIFIPKYGRTSALAMRALFTRSIIKQGMEFVKRQWKFREC